MRWLREVIDLFSGSGGLALAASALIVAALIFTLCVLSVSQADPGTVVRLWPGHEFTKRSKQDAQLRQPSPDGRPGPPDRRREHPRQLQAGIADALHCLRQGADREPRVRPGAFATLDLMTADAVDGRLCHACF